MKINIPIFFLILCFLNANGQSTFFQSYGGNGNDYGENIISCADSGFAAIGATESYGNGLTDLYVIKTNNIGEVMWHQTFGGQNIDYGKSIVETADSGFIACGYSNSQNLNYDVFIVKMDKNGNLEWSRRYGGADWDFGNKIIKSTVDPNNFYVVGQTYNYGSINGDGFVLKINSLGDSLWMKTYGGNLEDKLEDIVQSEDGKLFCIGSSYNFNLDPTLWITGCKENGDTLWNFYSDSILSNGKSITKIGNKIIFCGSIQPMQPTNIIPRTYYLVGGIDTLGNQLFYANFNYYSQNEQSCVEVVKKPSSNNYYLISNIHQFSNNKIYYAELNNQWVQAGTSNINGNINDIVKGLDTLQYSNGFIAIGNTEETNNGVSDIFISKTNNGLWDSNYGNNLLLSNSERNFNSAEVYPNPTKDFIEFINIKSGSEISIFNLRGELVEKYTYNGYKHSLEHIKTGIYLLELQQDLNKEYFKIIKL